MRCLGIVSGCFVNMITVPCWFLEMKDLPQQKYRLFLSSLLFLQIHNLSVYSVIALRLYSLIFSATESIPGVIDDTIISHLFGVYCAV